MIKVGLVGEDPNDTSAIKNLLIDRYRDKVKFCTLPKRAKVHQLETAKLSNAVSVEMDFQELKFVIYIADLDAFESQYKKLQEKKEWFNTVNKATGRNNILLLNIWELEALIFADIETFSKSYRINHKFKGNPTLIKEPKEKLMHLTQNGRKKYHESHCPEIFKKLRLDQLEKNCTYFKSFLAELDSRVN